MPIINQTKRKELAKEAILCNRPSKQAIGLMLHRKIYDQGLVFIFKKEKRISLHMFFVFFPIDVLYLDRNKKVVEIKENFRPFSFYTPRNKAMYIIELPSGKVKETGTTNGDLLYF